MQGIENDLMVSSCNWRRGTGNEHLSILFRKERGRGKGEGGKKEGKVKFEAQW